MVRTDRRNAHVSLFPVSDWATLLAAKFDIISLIDYLPEFDKKSFKQAFLKKPGLSDTRINSTKPQKGEVVFLVRAKETKT